MTEDFGGSPTSCYSKCRLLCGGIPSPYLLCHMRIRTLLPNSSKEVAKALPTTALAPVVLQTGWQPGKVSGLSPQTLQLQEQPERQTNKQKS